MVANGQSDRDPWAPRRKLLRDGELEQRLEF